MRLRGWYRRWRTLLGEAWWFGVVGAANVGVNFVVFNALVFVLLPGSELKANVVATAIATTSSYLMNRSWTFRHRKTSRIPREYVLFFLFNAVALTIELAVMGAAKYGLGLTTLWALNVAKALGLGLGTVFRFWTYRNFVFAAPPAQSPAAAGSASAAGKAAAAGNGRGTGSAAAAGNGIGTGSAAAAGNGIGTGSAVAAGNGRVTGTVRGARPRTADPAEALAGPHQ